MPFLNWINDDIARRQYKNVAFHLLEKQEHYGASDASNLLIQGIWTIGAKTPWMRDALQAAPATAGFPAA